MREVRVALGILVLIGILGALAFKLVEYRTRLGYLPDGFGAWRIVYAEGQVYGFGPGGNETGLVVYRMPPAMEAALAERGISWLNDLSARGDRGWRRGFSTWRTTPTGPETSWSDPALCRPGSAPRGSCPGIAVFLNRYGDGLTLRPEVEEMVNRALFAPGAYWSAGRGGLVVVIPDQDRIVFAHAG